MKVRDSGMPEQAYWEGLFDVPAILDALGVDAAVRDAVEIGCGYGTFTLPVAQRIAGTLHAFDIEPDMIRCTAERVRQGGVGNVQLQQRDVLTDGFGLAPASVDAVLLFNILHTEEPERLLRLSAEAVCVGGRLLVIHWRSDVTTPRGPAIAIRPRPEQIAGWAASVGGLAMERPAVIVEPWHFALSLRKIANESLPKAGSARAPNSTAQSDTPMGGCSSIPPLTAAGAR